MQMPKLGPVRLTPREIALARLVADGRTNGAIAAELGTTEGTIKVDLSRLYRKLRLSAYSCNPRVRLALWGEQLAKLVA
jgi:DNA-binding NarL/FixJ family response regulator